jgi:hypothetical protein
MRRLVVHSIAASTGAPVVSGNDMPLRIRALPRRVPSRDACFPIRLGAVDY